MGRPDGFMKYARRETRLRPAAVRIQDFEELHVPLSHEQRRQQAARCMTGRHGQRLSIAQFDPGVER